jgi:isopentenyl diphosphate isomerase/L-lactate dehydrogenase-like FMN-dependent dehydrogenase
VSGEDAAACIASGVDGMIVSNHGGRNEETLCSCIECLPEVTGAVTGRVPVLLDGGICRGTDVVKALALGATAVGIGRPQAGGLAAFGQPGVEAVNDILARELQVIHATGGNVERRCPSRASGWPPSCNEHRLAASAGNETFHRRRIDDIFRASFLGPG